VEGMERIYPQKDAFSELEDLKMDIFANEVSFPAK
jgi:hypothetical protein